MEKNHFIGVRFDGDLFNKLNNHDGKNSDILRVAVKQYLVDDDVKHVKRNVKQVDIDEDAIYDECYDECYDLLYNVEIIPLTEKIHHLSEMIKMLESDKIYFRDRMDALIIAKTPLLTRLKMRLLER